MEGGDSSCHIHTDESGNPQIFKTQADFIKHMQEAGHTLGGTAPCLYCQTSVAFDALPIPPQGKPVSALCPNCAELYAIPTLESMGYTVSKSGGSGKKSKTLAAEASY